MTVSTWRQWAVIDGVLRLTREHSRANHRATEFQVNLDALPPKGTLTAKQDSQDMQDKQESEGKGLKSTDR